MIVNENIIIINCGSQFTQLIARRLREMKVHTLIMNWDASAEKVKSYSPKGIIISGGPDSVNDPGAITIDPKFLSWAARFSEFATVCSSSQRF